MGIFDGINSAGAASRLTEEAFYAEALRELESGMRRDGIWAMAMAESDMDQGRAGARYIKLRVQSLKDEMTLQLSAAANAEQQRTARAKVEADAEAPRHPGCGGVITRSEIGNRVTWRCAKCKATGKFDRGVSYGEIKK
jgi:hypothetical protein